MNNRNASNRDIATKMACATIVITAFGFVMILLAMLRTSGGEGRTDCGPQYHCINTRIENYENRTCHTHLLELNANFMSKFNWGMDCPLDYMATCYTDNVTVWMTDNCKNSAIAQIIFISEVTGACILISLIFIVALNCKA
jgi:hypothetical protein